MGEDGPPGRLVTGNPRLQILALTFFLEPTNHTNHTNEGLIRVIRVFRGLCSAFYCEMFFRVSAGRHRLGVAQRDAFHAWRGEVLGGGKG